METVLVVEAQEDEEGGIQSVLESCLSNSGEDGDGEAQIHGFQKRS